MAWGSPPSRARRIDGTSQSKGYYTGGRKRFDLAAGAGDGRRARDGAGLRRRLVAAPGLATPSSNQWFQQWSLECSHARPNSTTRTRSIPKTHVQTIQASRGIRPASYVRTSAALGKFQARQRVPHTAARRRFLVNAAAPRSWPRRLVVIERGLPAGDQSENHLTKTG